MWSTSCQVLSKITPTNAHLLHNKTIPHETRFFIAFIISWQIKILRNILRNCVSIRTQQMWTRFKAFYENVVFKFLPNNFSLQNDINYTWQTSTFTCCLHQCRRALAEITETIWAFIKISALVRITQLDDANSSRCFHHLVTSSEQFTSVCKLVSA